MKHRTANFQNYDPYPVDDCSEMPCLGEHLLVQEGFSLNFDISWWRHQMETFSALLALCAGNSPVTGEFPSQRPVTQSFDACFDLRLNKRLSKQSWDCWFKTPSRSLWRHCNVVVPSWDQDNVWWYDCIRLECPQCWLTTYYSIIFTDWSSTCFH